MKKLTYTFYTLPMLATAYALSAVFAYAQPAERIGADGRTPGSEVSLKSPLAVGSITEFFTKLLEILTIFAIPIVAFFIIYAGFLYVTARGNASQVEQAHRALLYAVIGGVLILGGRVLIEVIQGTVDSVRR